jgi:hypothetical protein
MTRLPTAALALATLAAIGPGSAALAGGAHKGQRVVTRTYAVAPATTTYSLHTVPATTYALQATPATTYTLQAVPATLQSHVFAAPATQSSVLTLSPRPTLLSYTPAASYTLVHAASPYTLQAQGLEADPQSLQQAETYAVQYSAFAQKLGDRRLLAGLISGIKGQIRNGIRNRGQLLKFGADLALRLIPGNFLSLDDILAVGGIVDDLLGGGADAGGGGSTGGGTGGTGGGTTGGGTTPPITGATSFDVSGTLTLRPRSGAGPTPPSPTDDAIVEWQGQVNALEAKIQSLQTELNTLKSNPPKPEAK